MSVTAIAHQIMSSHQNCLIRFPAFNQTKIAWIAGLGETKTMSQHLLVSRRDNTARRNTQCDSLTRAVAEGQRNEYLTV